MPKLPPRPARDLTETQLGQLVRAKLYAQGVHMWRNNTGKLVDATGRVVTFGLGIGSPDLVGCHPLIVTPDMVGQKIAVSRFIELKSANRALTPDQLTWKALLEGLGAMYSVVRSVDDV